MSHVSVIFQAKVLWEIVSHYIDFHYRIEYLLCLVYDIAPFFDESRWVLVCEKLYAQDLAPEHMVVSGPIEKYYGAYGGWHRSYIGRVVEVYRR